MKLLCLSYLPTCIKSENLKPIFTEVDLFCVNTKSENPKFLYQSSDFRVAHVCMPAEDKQKTNTQVKLFKEIQNINNLIKSNLFLDLPKVMTENKIANEPENSLQDKFYELNSIASIKQVSKESLFEVKMKNGESKTYDFIFIEQSELLQNYLEHNEICNISKKVKQDYLVLAAVYEPEIGEISNLSNSKKFSFIFVNDAKFESFILNWFFVALESGKVVIRTLFNSSYIENAEYIEFYKTKILNYLCAEFSFNLKFNKIYFEPIAGFYSEQISKTMKPFSSKNSLAVPCFNLWTDQQIAAYYENQVEPLLSKMKTHRKVKEIAT